MRTENNIKFDLNIRMYFWCPKCRKEASLFSHEDGMAMNCQACGMYEELRFDSKENRFRGTVRLIAG